MANRSTYFPRSSHFYKWEWFTLLYENENEKAYIISYLSEGMYINIYVAKNSKNENCYPIVSVVTPRKLSEKEIEEATESLLNEAESFLK